VVAWGVLNPIQARALGAAQSALDACNIDALIAPRGKRVAQPPESSPPQGSIGAQRQECRHAACAQARAADAALPKQLRDWAHERPEHGRGVAQVARRRRTGSKCHSSAPGRVCAVSKGPRVGLLNQRRDRRMRSDRACRCGPWCRRRGRAGRDPGRGAARRRTGRAVPAACAVSPDTRAPRPAAGTAQPGLQHRARSHGRRPRAGCAAVCPQASEVLAAPQPRCH